MTPFDTVAAVSTPFGKGGVAVIRISGDEATTVASRVFRPVSGRPLTDHAPREAVYGRIVDPSDSRTVLDDGIAVYFAAPRSFTGEDTVEITCHGGVLVTRRVLAACFAAGAAQAMAGEFTRRAFMNGKLGLEEAEALGNLLDAGNEEQLTLARAGMQGYLGTAMEGIYASLCAALANLEAGMDFPEEDLTELTRDELIDCIGKASAEVSRLRDTYRTGHAIAEGVPTVLCGKPNAGKSALYNRLVGRDAAIVTDVPGTTRDLLSDTVSLGRVTLRLFDTAGLRETDDPVERIGVERARGAIDDAELILALFDGSVPCDGEDDALMDELARLQQGKTVLYLMTKSDLPTCREPRFPEDATVISLSAETGEGMDALRGAVEAAFIDGALRTGEEAVVFSARQHATLVATAQCLDTATESLTVGMPYDICAEDVRGAMDALGALSGRSRQEDVIGEIFAKFCVGK